MGEKVNGVPSEEARVITDFADEFKRAEDPEKEFQGLERGGDMGK